MANLIQIKRSLTTATPTTLANGEMAYTANGDNLFIGSNGVVVAIGGKKNPGVLTANQALVANSTSGIDKVIVANAAISKIYANGTHGSAGFILATDSANNLYWQDPNLITPAAAGTNGQIQFNGGTNDLTASDGLVFTVSSNTLSVGNTILTTTVNAATFSVGSDLVANSRGIHIVSTGGIQANGTYGSAGQVLTSNGTSVHWAVPVTDLTGLSDVDITSVSNNQYLVYDATAGQWENHSISGTTNEVEITFNSQNLTIGLPDAVSITTSLNVASGAVISNGTGVYTTGITNTNTLAVRDTTVSSNTTTGAATVAGGLGVAGRINTEDLAAGNTTVYSTLTGTSLTTANVFATATVNASVLSIGSWVIANNSGVFTSGIVNGDILAVGSNFRANTTQVTSAVPTVLNANVTLGDANSDVVTINGEVNSNIIPSANVTYNLGSSVDRWNYVYAANVHSSRGYFEGNVEIAGDLIVTGNVTTINVSSLEVTDPLIYLAGNNYASDLVDIGFVGNYYDGSTQRHAGIVRHAADDKFYLFKGYTAEPDNNVIDVGNTSLGYQVAQLSAYIDSGALVTNSTAVSITANSTVAVNITANSITLNTPLAATSGGTDHNTYTSGDLLVANTGNTLSKLGLGTDGQVLQSNGTALIYGMLDGGTF